MGKRLDSWLTFFKLVNYILISAAILAAALWFIWQGGFSPKLKARHQVSHRQLDDNWTWVHLSLAAENVGRVPIGLEKVRITLQKVLPLEKATEEALGQGVLPASKDGKLFEWPALDDAHELELQEKLAPGQVKMVVKEFIISSNVEAIRIYTNIESQKGPTLGWETVTIYDLEKQGGLKEWIGGLR